MKNREGRFPFVQPEAVDFPMEPEKNPCETAFLLPDIAFIEQTSSVRGGLLFECVSLEGGSFRSVTRVRQVLRMMVFSSTSAACSHKSQHVSRHS